MPADAFAPSFVQLLRANSKYTYVYIFSLAYQYLSALCVLTCSTLYSVYCVLYALRVNSFHRSAHVRPAISFFRCVPAVNR